MMYRLQNQIEEFNIIPQIQFGFKHSHSAELQTTRVAEYIIAALNTINHTGGIIILRIEKAFNRIKHDSFVRKMLQKNINTNFKNPSIHFLQIVTSVLKSTT